MNSEDQTLPHLFAATVASARWWCGVVVLCCVVQADSSQPASSSSIAAVSTNGVMLRATGSFNPAEDRV